MDMQINQIKRVKLTSLPTPLEEMKNLSEVMNGPRIYVKRDDLTSIGFGGNKARKLEYIMADAVEKGANVVITAGGLQSNWARMTAAAAKRMGMDVILALFTAQFKGKVRVYDGNMLLDYLMGADIRFIEGGITDALEAETYLTEIAEEEKGKGNIPYVIPISGDVPLGGLGYVSATQELVNQAEEQGLCINYLVVAAGAGGTQAGLEFGVREYSVDADVVGVNVGALDRRKLQERIVTLVDQVRRLMKANIQVNSTDVTVLEDYAGFAKYGVLTDEVLEAMKLIAKTEGIFLDPVYTGKAMAGLVHLIKESYFSKDETVVFIHTGGLPGLFPYKEKIMR